MPDDKTPGRDYGQVMLPSYLSAQWTGCWVVLVFGGIMLFFATFGYLTYRLFFQS